MKYEDQPKESDWGQLIIECPSNIGYGCVSASGKSFTYRTHNDGEHYGPYQFFKLPFAITSARSSFYHRNDIFMHDFGQGEQSAVKITYRKI